MKLQPVLRGQFLDKCLVRIGSFAAQFVIEVHHAEHDAQFLAQLQQQQQQRHRVCPARHRHANAVAWPYHFLFLQTGEEALPEQGPFDVSVRVPVSPTRHKPPATSHSFASSRASYHAASSRRPLWMPVEIVNPLLTFLPALGILLGLWMCLSTRQGGFAL